MSIFHKIYFRLWDRTLDRPIRLPIREDLSRGEWNAWVGEQGEALAAKAVWRSGRKLLYRNYRPKRGGEVDLIYRDGSILVFAEVKTRTSGEFGGPAKAVDREKRSLIIRGASAWIKALHRPEGVLLRFDVIEVLLKDQEIPRIRINEAVFASSQQGLGM
jgi:putative endonuclease